MCGFRQPLTPGHDVELAYVLDGDKGGRRGFSSSPTEELLEGSLSLKGMILTGNPPDPGEINVPDKYESLFIKYREDDTGRYYDVADVVGAAESCILRGYHYWICAPDSSSMTCRDCDRLQLARRKSKKKKKKKSAVSVEHTRNVPAPIVMQKPSEGISPDIVYDAICYRGSGTWNELQSIVAALVEQPWDLAAVTKNLVDLGLVDIMLDGTCLKPSRWSCPPPALVIDLGGNAFLSGFRNDDLIARMDGLFSGVARAYRAEEQDMAPSAHLWELENVSIEELEGLINGVRDPHGRKMQVVNAPGESIVIAMPTMGEASGYMSPVHIEDNGDIERFDPRTGKWQPAALDGTGAYRTFYAGRRYFYHGADRTSREGSFEMVKLLAGRDEGVYLHGYDNVFGCFESVIGVEPPGLYRRALVSCSGVLPKKENGKLIYSGVPMSLASLLMFKLYE